MQLQRPKRGVEFRSLVTRSQLFGESNQDFFFDFLNRVEQIFVLG